MGKGFLVRPLALGAVTAEGSAAGTLPSYLGNDYMGVVHRGTGNPAGWVQCDLGSAQACDFAAFLSSNAAAAATLRVRADDDADLVTENLHDSGVITFAAGATAPTSGRRNSWWQPPGAAITQRYWRFDVAALTAPFEAGRLVMGAKFGPTLNFSFGYGRGAKDLGQTDFTRDGALFRRRGRILRTLNISYTITSKAEIEASVLPLFEGIGNTDFLLAVVDPDVNARRESRMYFGPTQGDLTAVHRVADGFEWRIQLLSVI